MYKIVSLLAAWIFAAWNIHTRYIDQSRIAQRIAVANRWNYTRVLRQSDDSFGEFRRKSVHRQHGYLLCNVASPGGKWYRRRSGKAALYEILLNRRCSLHVPGPWSASVYTSFVCFDGKWVARNCRNPNERKRDRWRKILARETSRLYKSLPNWLRFTSKSRQEEIDLIFVREFIPETGPACYDASCIAIMYSKR